MENKDFPIMNQSDEQFEQHLALIKRMYERMQRENSWPWVFALKVTLYLLRRNRALVKL